MKQVVFIAVFIFCILLQSHGQNYYEQHKKCSGLLKGHTPENEIFWERLQQRDSCLLGAYAPAFEASTLEGEKWNTESLKGKVVVLNFWFTKCKPCIEEMPLLNAMVSKYKNENVVFLSFANDDATKLKQFLATTEFNFKVVPNSNALTTIFKLFAVWPTTIVIDKAGKIKMIKVGGFDKSSIHELEFFLMNAQQ